jgi:DNA recombination protein RmuC
VVIRLPESRSIIIDAKVSLTDYERFVSSEEESEREVHLSQHIGSIRGHIDELAKKDYASLPELKSPDFVMMFVPIEASLSVALIKDTNLFAYAWEKGVVLVSPTTLLMGLKTIATLWRHEKQTKNVQEIAKA